MLPILAGDSLQNLVLYSEQIDNAVWIASETTVTADQDNAPTGGLTAELCVPVNSSAFLVQQDNPVIPNTNVTWSIWLRSATGGDVVLDLTIIDNTLNPVLNTEEITVTTVWRRFVVTANVGARTVIAVVVGAFGSWGSGEDLYAWGAQLNQGVTAGSYVKTVATRVL